MVPAVVTAHMLDSRSLEVLHVVQALRGPDEPIWLVGGVLRELLSGERPKDLDLAVERNALALGRLVATRLGATFVLLDEARGACRIVGRPQIDLVDLRAPTIEQDLRARDFTVNALAVSVSPLIHDGSAPVLDPTGGRLDLAARRVRLAGPRALDDDPVRVLRAVRLSIREGWAMSTEVEAAARAAAPGLTRVAAERVRDELVGLLADARAGLGLRLLDRLGAMAVILPESIPMRATSQPWPHHFDVWEHSLRTVEAADALTARPDGLEPWSEPLAAHLAEPLGGATTRAETLKIAALLHDIAKPETRSEVDGRVRFFGHDVLGAERAFTVAGRLRLGRRASTVVERLVRSHLRPMHLAQAGEITRRARYRFFRDLGDDAQDLLLLALADGAGLDGASPFVVWRGPGGAIVRELMAGVAEDRVSAERAPLLRGDDVMRSFGIASGPEVGRLLALSREAEALGLVSTRAEALDYLAQQRTKQV